LRGRILNDMLNVDRAIKIHPEKKKWSSWSKSSLSISDQLSFTHLLCDCISASMEQNWVHRSCVTVGNTFRSNGRIPVDSHIHRGWSDTIQQLFQMTNFLFIWELLSQRTQLVRCILFVLLINSTGVGPTNSAYFAKYQPECSLSRFHLKT
jgi:hypothetical protein